MSLSCLWCSTVSVAGETSVKMVKSDSETEKGRETCEQQLELWKSIAEMVNPKAVIEVPRDYYKRCEEYGTELANKMVQDRAKARQHCKEYCAKTLSLGAIRIGNEKRNIGDILKNAQDNKCADSCVESWVGR